ncbi:hypothetical protein DFH09DRAFT_1108874 [Mycena vulgaris]|nr:hypothetical protein DFH09DRAFT_1108874 [Mycena vulgaris]
MLPAACNALPRVQTSAEDSDKDKDDDVSLAARSPIPSPTSQAAVHKQRAAQPDSSLFRPTVQSKSRFVLDYVMLPPRVTSTRRAAQKPTPDSQDDQNDYPMKPADATGGGDGEDNKHDEYYEEIQPEGSGGSECPKHGNDLNLGGRDEDEDSGEDSDENQQEVSGSEHPWFVFNCGEVFSDAADAEAFTQKKKKNDMTLFSVGDANKGVTKFFRDSVVAGEHALRRGYKHLRVFRDVSTGAKILTTERKRAKRAKEQEEAQARAKEKRKENAKAKHTASNPVC